MELYERKVVDLDTILPEYHQVRDWPDGIPSK